MKNGKRIMACLLLLVLALSLCSCRWLTEKRDRQAFWNNEAHTEILWKGEVYRELPTLDVDQLGNTEIVITEPDVPVLLADSFGTFASASYSGLFISFWDYSLYRENPHRIFVKDSDYEYVKKAAETEEMDHCSAMVRMSDTENGNGTWFQAALLEDKTQEILEKYLAGEISPMTEEEISRLEEDYMAEYIQHEYPYTGTLMLSRCDSRMYFRKNFGEIVEYLPAEENGENVYVLCLTDDTGNYQMYPMEADLYQSIMEQVTGDNSIIEPTDEDLYYR